MRIDCYSDSGHGWARVPLELLNWLGLLDRITPFSYLRGGYAYLEEDCDLTVFAEACRSAGLPIEFKMKGNVDGRSRIRNYLHYYPDLARQHMANGREWRPAWKPPKVLTRPAEAVL